MHFITPPAQHLGILADLDPAPASGQMGAHGRGRLAVRSFGVGTVAHFQEPGQVFTGSEASIHTRFDIRRRVGIAPILFFQLGLPAEELGQTCFMFEQLALMRADNFLYSGDLLFEPGSRLLQLCTRFFKTAPFLREIGLFRVCSA